MDPCGTIPIVTVTDNRDGWGDWDRVKEAWMNDFTPTPVDNGELKRLIGIPLTWIIWGRRICEREE